MPLYRQLLITAADAPIQTLLRKAALDVSARGGVIRHVQNYGLQRMAYPLYDRKSRAGTRHDMVRMAFTFFDAPTDAVRPVEEVMLYDEAVLRVSTTRERSTAVDECRRRARRERLTPMARQEQEAMVAATLGAARWDDPVVPDAAGVVYSDHGMDEALAFQEVLKADRAAFEERGDGTVWPMLRLATNRDATEVTREVFAHLQAHGKLPWHEAGFAFDEPDAGLSEAERAARESDSRRRGDGGSGEEDGGDAIASAVVPSADALRAAFAEAEPMTRAEFERAFFNAADDVDSGVASAVDEPADAGAAADELARRVGALYGSDVELESVVDTLDEAHRRIDSLMRDVQEAHGLSDDEVRAALRDDSGAFSDVFGELQDRVVERIAQLREEGKPVAKHVGRYNDEEYKEVAAMLKKLESS